MATNPLFLNDDEATPFSHAHTYIAGEDNSRLASAARQFGLHQIRQPLGNVRALAQAILRDSTLESARMHSVGALGSDEHVDDTGTLHLTTLTRRTKTPQAPPGDYGTLQDLFRQPAAVVLPEEEEEYEDQVEGGSLTAAIFGIIKGTVGPAILYLPRGFSLAGWIVAIVSMLIATTSFLYSSRRLLQCWRVEKTKVEKLQEIKKLLLEDEQHDNTTILLTYPELARRAFGSWAAFVQFGIAGMQFGVCLTYLIFVPQNLVESTRVLFGLEVDSWVFLLCMLMIEIPLTWIRDIRRLTYTNILATVLIAYGLASCLGIALHKTFQDPSTNLWQRLVNLPATNDTWYLFVGTSFFVFEGSITLLVPLQEAVYRKEDKAKFPTVNQTVTSWIVVFYIFFAMICWASFGNGVKTALTASLPDETFSTVVQFAYSIAVIFTFPLQAFPALEIVFHSSQHSAKGDDFKRNSQASLITCLLGIVALFAINYLGNVVSLLGSLVGIPIALIFPPLMHNRLVKDSSPLTRMLNYFVAGLGVFAMAAASFTTIVSWDKGAES